MNEIGQKIQIYRQKSGLTQEALAEKLNVSRQSVSKWELGQTLPEVDKIIAMSRLFSTSTDELLFANVDTPKPRDLLRFGSVYLVVKNMQATTEFYEKLLCMRVSTRHPVFAEFFFDSHCIALMDEKKIDKVEHPASKTSNNNYKFVLNFYVQDLIAEQLRIKDLDIGQVTEIEEAHPGYFFFHVRDPEHNVIEINGNVYDTRRNEEMQTIECQSCSMPMKEEQYGTLKGGEKTSEYCHYCYEDGEYTTPQTLDEAIEGNLPFWLEDCNNDPDLARKTIREVFSKLNRWKMA